MTVIDHVRERARERPHHPALVVDRGPEGEPVRVSYAQLVRSFDDVARRLRAHPVSPFARCGLVAKQGPGFIVGALGILAADLCLVPLPDDSAPTAVERSAAEARLHYLVRGADGFACRTVAPVTVLARDSEGVPALPPGVRPIEPLSSEAESAFRACAPAYLRFTSGTTSRHKGVVIGHEAILARLANANAGLGITPEDRILWVLPLAHHFVVSILLYLRFGATILLPASALARHVLGLAAGERATVFYASPFHYRLLATDRSETQLAHLRLAVSTADRLPADVAARFAARFGVHLVQALGIIEVGLPIMNLASAATKPEALGRPLPGYTLTLRGEDGRPLAHSAADRTGEICLRGAGTFDAYLDPWTPSRAIVEPDGFPTGDYGWLDDDGDLHLAGRRANRVSMAGMKFFCEEVEAVLDAHPLVERSRVVARAHAQLGEIPIAEVVAANPARPPREADLIAYCRERLPAYKIPRQIAVVEDVPLTSTGKVRRWAEP